MKRSFLIAMGVVAALGLSGCKIVFDEEKDAAAIPDGPDGDNARNTARIDATFEAELLPYLQENALSVTELRSLVAKDIDAAGAEHANRGSGQGAAWNFPITGTGSVLEAKLDTRARTVSLDTDGDNVVIFDRNIGWIDFR